MSSTRDSLDLKLQASRSPKNIAKNSSGGYRPAPGMAAQPAHSAMGMAAQLGHSAMGMTAQPSHPAPTLPRSHAHYQLPPTQVASPQLPVQVDYIRNSSNSTTPTATPPASIGIPSPTPTVSSPGANAAYDAGYSDADSVHGSVLGPTPSSSFDDLIASILQERNKDLGDHSRLRVHQSRFNCEERTSGFVMVNVDTFWSHLFLEHFIQASDHELRDDMLMFVRKVSINNSAIKTEVEVYRRVSPNLPSLGDPSIDWEETVYLNLILQQFEYTLTVAVCTRTSEKDLQILKKFSQQVYASPSKRQMDGKGEKEVMAYPNIFFTIDNFDEVFTDIVIRDEEVVCVELLARDKTKQFSSVLFIGSIKYEALKRVYDSRAGIGSKFAQRISWGIYKGAQRMEFVRMKGPAGKGHAEMAVSKTKNSDYVTPDYDGDFPMHGWDQEIPFPEPGDPLLSQPDHPEFDRRRMSDPSNAMNGWTEGGYRGRTTGSIGHFAGAYGNSGASGGQRGANGIPLKKSTSEHIKTATYTVAEDGTHEVTAASPTAELREDDEYASLFGTAFGQAWYWLKERKRASSVALNAYVTYVTLPWHWIVADLLERKREPILTF